MVLIPSDVGVRMRTHAEASQLAAVSAAASISAELPDLVTGQLFRAQVREVLPQGTFKALVGGKEALLSLPENVKAGDSLELVVVERKAQVVVARLANPTDGATREATDPFTRLSPAAKLIGTLLPKDGEVVPPAALNKGQPVMMSPPTSVAETASALQTAVRKSGVFYEAHQAQWVVGTYPLAELLEEPQAEHSDFPRIIQSLLRAEEHPHAKEKVLPDQTSSKPQFSKGVVQFPSAYETPADTPYVGEGTSERPVVRTLNSGSPPLPAGEGALEPGNEGSSGTQYVPEDWLPELADNVPTKDTIIAPERVASPSKPPVQGDHAEMSRVADVPKDEPRHAVIGGKPPTEAASVTPEFGLPVRGTAEELAAGTTPEFVSKQQPPPAELRGLVQQQLDALATGRAVWHGEIWPQQAAYFEIEREAHHQEGVTQDIGWSTRVAMTMPALGPVDARLRIVGRTLSIALQAGDDTVRTMLQEGLPTLQARLEAAGLQLVGASVTASSDGAGAPG